MTASTVDTARLVAWLGRYRDLVVENKDALTELDTAIGDSDHGANMARGMNAVVEKLEAAPPASPAELFKGVGMTLVSTVGGAAGPLYGTFFLRLAPAVGDADSLDAAALATALRAGLDGVVARGKAEAGDKTMFDALAPAVDALDAAVSAGSPLAEATQAAADAAAAGRDATAPLQARKGRASYLGERSVGHIDPGSASTALLLQALAETVAA